MNTLCNILKGRAFAAAHLRGSEKYAAVHGTVRFYRACNAVLVYAEVFGLPEKAGVCESPVFGFHIHSGPACTGTQDDPFANANAHYNPNNCQHPFHAGDLPPLFGVNGRACAAFLTNRFTPKEIIDRTVIIHADPDDFITQPSGNSGEKIACGVILRR